MADALDPAHPVRRVVPLRGDVLGRRLAADLWTSSRCKRTQVWMSLSMWTGTRMCENGLVGARDGS